MTRTLVNVARPMAPGSDSGYYPTGLWFVTTAQAAKVRAAKRAYVEALSAPKLQPDADTAKALKPKPTRRVKLHQPLVDPLKAVNDLLAKPNYTKPATFTTNDIDSFDAGSDTDMNDLDNYDRQFVQPHPRFRNTRHPKGDHKVNRKVYRSNSENARDAANHERDIKQRAITRRRRNQAKLDRKALDYWHTVLGGFLAEHWSNPVLAEQHFAELITVLNEAYFRKTGLIGPFEYVLTA